MIDRRTLLKMAAALSAAVPLSRMWTTGTATESTQRNLSQYDLTTRQRAGQRVIYSYAGTSVPDSLLQVIRNGEAAGVIFFGENIVSSNQIASVARQLQDAQEQSPIPAPLLLMTDQEGGPVRRLPGDPIESAKQIGLSTDPPSAARAAGTAAGRNLAASGMNVNLAPVLGVYREEGDFLDQYERSFSSKPDVVAACAWEFISAQQATGVAATAKHFPGLGAASASENTDAGSVSLPLDLSTIREVDEAPYDDAISAGAKLVMLSWAVYPSLGPNYPAGLSSTVVQGELRQRLGYDGVTITDAIEAGSLNMFGPDADRAVLAAQAGMDLILCSARDVDQGISVTNALAAALESGNLDASPFDAAVSRIEWLRSGLATRRYFPETERWVGHGFLSYWMRFGGLPVFGYPITDEFTDTESGLVTQWFERARFEWHPGSWPERYDVVLGRLGVELAEHNNILDTEPFLAVEGGENSSCIYFPETGHWLCYGFREFWQNHGGLEILGYPISEEFADQATGLTVQYFERQRLEWHPENDPEWEVLGGLLGSELVPPEAR